MAQFAIPRSASSLIKIPESELNLRQSESQIFKELGVFQPVVSEKNVWAFWDKGLDVMYPSYRHTVLNWVRKLGTSWTVRVVDLAEGSPNNIYNFVSRDWFPDSFNDQTMDGPHAAQHAADLVRLPLLFVYGGVWMDVGNMLHTHLDRLFWDALSTPDSQYEMGAWIISDQIRKQWGSFGNYMLAARKSCTFIENWHNSYKELWKSRTNAEGFHDLPLIRDIGLAEGMADWDFQDKIQKYVGLSTGWNGREFFNNKIFMVEGIYNGVLGAIRTDFDGHKQVELLTTPLNDPDMEKTLAAEAFVIEMLEKSHMYKVYHNSAGGLPALGDLIKMEGFLDAEHRPGTFAEMYRYGTVH